MVTVAAVVDDDETTTAKKKKTTTSDDDDARASQQRPPIDDDDTAPSAATPKSKSKSKSKSTTTTTPVTYRASQRLIETGCGWMYFLAFLGAWNQNPGLIGDDGIAPSRPWFDALRESYRCGPESTALTDGGCRNGFLDHPSLFWWFRSDRNDYDDATELLAAVGATLSLLCAVGGLGRGRPMGGFVVWMALWISYFTIVTSAGGTSFYSYGWESQLLETGFLCAFLSGGGGLWSVATTTTREERHHRDHRASIAVMWLFRWLSFRISIGAGMIKIRGDSCWTDRTCLLHHFETQPIPNPLSFAFHFLPDRILRTAVDLDLFVQVYTSWFVLVPHALAVPSPKKTRRGGKGGVSGGGGLGLLGLRLVRLGGWIQTLFMVNIALSGNMSMLNHLTILPALACLDDGCYPSWFKRLLLGPSTTTHPTTTFAPSRRGRRRWWKCRAWIDRILLVTILVLSRPVVENLLEIGEGGRQKMNASFGSFRLVNSYGAFGSVGKRRYEPIISVAWDGESENDGDENDDDEEGWIEIGFPCKPGAVDRRPCFCAPYHYRLDWNIWFLGFKPHAMYLNRRETWLYGLLSKMLEPSEDEGDDEGRGRWWSSSSRRRRRKKKPWLDLLDGASSDLLESRGPPSRAKVDMYRYEMAAPLWEILSSRLRRRRWLRWFERRDDDDDAVVVRWWNRWYEESLLPEIAYDPSRGGLVRAERNPR